MNSFFYSESEKPEKGAESSYLTLVDVQQQIRAISSINNMQSVAAAAAAAVAVAA